MPTPARPATASRLASAPPALNTAVAASSKRSRLRTASERDFRTIAADGPVIFNSSCCSPALLQNGGFLRITCKTEDTSVYALTQTGGNANRRHSDGHPCCGPQWPFDHLAGAFA